MRRLRPLWLLCTLLISGCAGYHLGPTNGLPPGARSIEITPFVNKTPEPRLIDAVTTAVRRQIQQEGTYRLETRGTPDFVLRGVILRFDRGELAYQPGDIITPRDYLLSMDAEIFLIDQSTGKTNLTQLVSGSTVIRVGADLASAERQAVPLMAADLARHIRAYVADGPW